MFKEKFQARIKELFEEDYDFNTPKMAKEADISTASLNFYLHGKRCPDAQALYKMCTAYGVSADWLLGLSDFRSVDPSVQAACKQLSMSETAIEHIQTINKPFVDQNKVPILSELFEMNPVSWYGVMCNLEKHIFHRNTTDSPEVNKEFLQSQDREDKCTVLNHRASAEYYMDLCVKEFRKMLEKDFDKYLSIQSMSNNGNG